LWLVPWVAIAGKLPGSTVHRHQAPRAASYAAIASTRGLWGSALGLFGGNYAWYFLLNWLPYYFETARHYTHDRLAFFASVPFWSIALSSTCFGLLADYFIHHGGEPGFVRRRFVCCGLISCSILMFAAIKVKAELPSNILLVLAFIALGAWSSNHWAFSQLLAGPTNAGKWTGLQNCIGNFAGVLGPWLSGYALQKTHSFFAAFAIACGFLIMGLAAYWFIVGTPSQVFRDDPTFDPPATIEMPAGELRH
jgi:ACS family D-galactonate transporter-like MFS transporter